MLILSVILLLPQLVESGTFLFYFPFASRSHQIGFMAAVNGLAERGHSVTIITANVETLASERISQILIHYEGREKLEKKINEDALVSGRDGGGTTNMPLMEIAQMCVNANEAALTHPDTRKYLSEGKTFDVLLTSPFFSMESGYFLANKFNSSLVLFGTSSASLPWLNWAGGNPFNPSYMPLGLLPYTQNMNFLQRLVNTIATVVFTFVIRDWYMLGNVDLLLHRVFPGQEIPDLRALEKNVALSITQGSTFLNDGLRPMLPNSILAGFMTCTESKPLPQDLQVFKGQVILIVSITL